MRRSVSVIVGLCLPCACDPGDVRLLAPEGTTSDEVTRVHVALDTPYVTLGPTLGWEAGIPGATLRLHRTDEPYDEAYWVSFTTDGSGGVAIHDVLAGLYEVEVSRALTAAERSAVGDLTMIVAGGRLARLPTEQLKIATEPNHAGALVFSEVAITAPLPWETGGGNYDDGKYLEIYNNSAETVYLDGMLFGVAYLSNNDSSFRPCSMSEVALNDPGGIWTQHVLRFPGQGVEFPVEPGGVVLLAKSAVDHRPVHPSLMDLTNADFEWGGQRTADNPSAPNLTDVGPTRLYSPLPISDSPVFLARPMELDGLPSWIHPYDGHRYIRIPADAVLDAMAPLYDFTRASYEPLERCLHALNPAFERLPGPALWSGSMEASYSLRRRVLGVSPDGRRLLQDTNTSMVDFVRAMGTPGWIPDAPDGP
ncbi:MAG: hypothetical protein Q8N53_24220 [Longimicrobiales bacterium]|nr:hypothetical protein [Longimicrobiales bacterium]